MFLKPVCFRRHQKTIDKARQSLEEYKQTLKLRYAPVAMTAAQTPPSLEAICSTSALPHRTHSAVITHCLNADSESHIFPETPVVNTEQSHNTVKRADPEFPNQPPSSPALSTHQDIHVIAQPISVPITVSHLVHEDDLAPIPPAAASSLLNKTPSDGNSEHQEVPLLPPAVFLEYLRSRRSQAPPTLLPPLSQQGTKDPGVVLREAVEDIDPCYDTAREINQQTIDQIQKQRDALRALLEQHAKVTRTG